MTSGGRYVEMLPDAHETVQEARADVRALREAVQTGGQIDATAMDGVLKLVSLAERVETCMEVELR
jgi:hypothetical protein